MKGKESFLGIILGFIFLILAGTALSFVMNEGDKTYIVDRTGERWDVNQAKSLGFRPEGFQYGIGRYAFDTLDDSHLSPDSSAVPPHTRVIGVKDGSGAQAYSVPKLMRHEIANTNLGKKPITVGY
ncbi:hypothetical protein ACFL9T_14940 [Thermodesulfobacteriota bacterium]